MALAPILSVLIESVQAFGGSRLDGVRLHWGIATGEHRQWLQAPAGWLSDPAEYHNTGALRAPQLYPRSSDS